jgi:predicted small lipoprotein YifL
MHRSHVPLVALAAPVLALLMLVACATSGGAGPVEIPPGAVEVTRTEPNGDVVTEYRVGTQLRVVKVVPRRGPTYYLQDRDGDGIVDGDRDGVSPVYFKLFEW